MKRVMCILVCLCSVVMTCSGCDPDAEKKGRSPVPRLEGGPVDYLRATRVADPDSQEELFRRALAQEKLGLTAEAIRSWDEIVASDRSEWKTEARMRRDALLRMTDPADQWSPAALDTALRARDRKTVTKIVKAFPANAERHFETSDLLDLEASRLFADVLLQHGDAYPRDIVAAIEHTRNRDALERGVQAFRDKEFERAATLLDQAGNPLLLRARFEIARAGFIDSDILPLLDTIPANEAHRDLSSRAHTLRGAALDQRGSYAEALKSYERALEVARREPTTTAAALARRSGTYRTIGLAEEAFRDAFDAVALLPKIADGNARLNTYGSAATVARDLGYADVALQYLDTGVAAARKDVTRAFPDLQDAKLLLAVALRARADAYVYVGREVEAAKDLEEATLLAEAAGDQETLALLRMRLHEVSGHLLMERSSAEAIAELTKAIDLAPRQNFTYRADLYFKRATARRNAQQPGADDDIAEAFRILREEAKTLLKERVRGDYEELWRPYFSRFRQMQDELIDSLILQNDFRGAFVYSEQARAFEPMHLLLQSQAVPRRFRKIQSLDDLEAQLANIPDDTVILQYAVLDDKSYAWVLTRGDIRVVPLAQAPRSTIERWVGEINTVIDAQQWSAFPTALFAAYDGLFEDPLSLPEAATRNRLVIVPDGPMHALPFAALRGAADRALIERYSIAVAGSTSLYLYALQRNDELPRNPKPSALIVGNPTFDPGIGERLHLAPLEHAHEEAIQLGRDYPGAMVLLGADATPDAFLAAAGDANIIHFAGHGVASPRSPWNSMLVLAREGNDSGELTAVRLLSEVASLDRTRLVVLAACSSASGQTVGPEGVAPLVRPFIAANVPAVVGTLWDVRDATAKTLTVSLHCRYRNGDDVAVALQKAQLEMLRKKVPAMLWAPFQVTGYAESPYGPDIAMEKTHNDHVCSENSLHRPDGLHPQ